MVPPFSRTLTSDSGHPRSRAKRCRSWLEVGLHPTGASKIGKNRARRAAFMASTGALGGDRMPFMRRVMTGGILAGLLLLAAPAWSQEPVLERNPYLIAEAEAGIDWARLAREFEAAVARYVSLLEYTRRIEAEREQQAFDEA